MVGPGPTGYGVGGMKTQALTVILEPSITKLADYSGALTDRRLARFSELVITLDILSAERDSADETYDFYITTGEGDSAWDIVHFPQIASTGVKRYTARLLSARIAEVTTATPGTSAECSGTFKTDTAGAGEGIKTLGAGKARHGPWGSKIGYELVIAGTVVTGVNYSIRMQAR